MKRLIIITGIMLLSVSALAFQFTGPGGGGKRYNVTVSQTQIKGPAWVSQGVYSSTATRQHAVTYAGSTWIALQNNTNQTPSDGSAYWAKYISKGDTGATGPQGPAGSVTAASGLNFTQRQMSSGTITILPPFLNDPTGIRGLDITVAPGSNRAGHLQYSSGKLLVDHAEVTGGSGLSQSANDDNKADGTSWINTTTKEILTRIGNEIYKAAMTLKTTLVAILGLDSNSTDHGSVTAGQESSHVSHTLSNTGPVSATNVTFTNTSSALFRNVSSACGSTLAAGANCIFKTAYTPLSATTNSGHINITADGGLLASLALSGTGTSAGATVLVGLSDLGSATTGYAANNLDTLFSCFTANATGIAANGYAVVSSNYASGKSYRMGIWDHTNRTLLDESAIVVQTGGQNVITTEHFVFSGGVTISAGTQYCLGIINDSYWQAYHTSTGLFSGKAAATWPSVPSPLGNTTLGYPGYYGLQVTN